MEIENPAGEVVDEISDRINEDDWMPGMSGQDPSAPSSTLALCHLLHR